MASPKNPNNKPQNVLRDETKTQAPLTWPSPTRGVPQAAIQSHTRNATFPR